jgi:hypothetical protein
MGTQGNWVWLWRAFAVVGIGFMLFFGALMWAAWRASPFLPVANGQVVQSGIDVIAVQLDILSLIIAVLGVGLGVMGFFGYQAIREAAVTAAQTATKAEIELIAPPLIRREVAEYRKTFAPEAPISDAEVDKMVKALGSDGEEDSGGK